MGQEGNKQQFIYLLIDVLMVGVLRKDNNRGN